MAGEPQVADGLPAAHPLHGVGVQVEVGDGGAQGVGGHGPGGGQDEDIGGLAGEAGGAPGRPGEAPAVAPEQGGEAVARRGRIAAGRGEVRPVGHVDARPRIFGIGRAGGGTVQRRLQFGGGGIDQPQVDQRVPH